MRKVLGGALVAGALVSQVAAVDILRTDDAYVNIYGTLRGFAGYGTTMISSPWSQVDDGLMFGVQGNSRLGVRAGVGSFNANVEIGANEETVYRTGANNIGLRQAWGSYTFDSGSVLLAGKTDTIDSMSGFSSDVFFNDGGAVGFGGLSTGIRRFQVQYKVGGFALSLSENDADDLPQLQTGVQWLIPRISAGYSIKSPDLLMNLAATYTFANSYFDTRATDNYDRDVNVFSLVFGIKPKLYDGAYLSLMLSYGLNDTITGQQSVGVPGILGATGRVGYSSFSGARAPQAGAGDDVDNLHRVSGLIELGAALSDDVNFVIGAGYQYAKVESQKAVSTYSVYAQTPIKLSSFFSIIPQVGWYGYNSGVDAQVGDGDKQRVSSLLAAAQLRFTF